MAGPGRNWARGHRRHVLGAIIKRKSCFSTRASDIHSPSVPARPEQPSCHFPGTVSHDIDYRSVDSSTKNNLKDYLGLHIVAACGKALVETWKGDFRNAHWQWQCGTHFSAFEAFSYLFRPSILGQTASLFAIIRNTWICLVPLIDVKTSRSCLRVVELQYCRFAYPRCLHKSSDTVQHSNL